MNKSVKRMPSGIGSSTMIRSVTNDSVSDSDMTVKSALVIQTICNQSATGI